MEAPGPVQSLCQEDSFNAPDLCKFCVVYLSSVKNATRKSNHDRNSEQHHYQR
jgi:hypothetical protein